MAEHYPKSPADLDRVAAVNDRAHRTSRADLKAIARRAMVDRGLEPDFSRDALAELGRLRGPAPVGGIQDLRSLLWVSIDNDDSRDLDQISVAEAQPDKTVKVRVAVADVDGVVAKGTALDGHARQNTTSVYTAAEIFSMLPEKLSTDWTSLNENEDRVAMVVEMVFETDGQLRSSAIYRAAVRNKAQLAYDSVSTGLEDGRSWPAKASAVPGVPDQLQLQDRVTQTLKKLRHEHGALDLETIEPKAVFEGDTIVDVRIQPQNRARNLIEDLMVAANGVTARFLAAKGYPSLRRVVRSPERWSRIVSVAAEYGEKLPAEPDAGALEAFLVKRRKTDPLRFPDLSLVIVKLMGRGEYVVERPGQSPIGHFGLAVQDYSHSTAPNRRFPDLVTHRLLKAALAGEPSPYGDGELDPARLALHRARGRCEQGRAAGAQVRRRPAHGASHRPAVRRDRHRRQRQGRLGPPSRASHRGQARARGGGPRGGAPPARQADIDRLRTRIH